MADIVLNDINPRIQITAAGGATVFAYPFPIYANTDLVVYQTPVGTVANDVANLLTYNLNYSVTNNVAPAVGGTITLFVPANAGDIITIIRDMPQNRLVNYLDGGQWSATQFNTDFDRTVMMSQTDKMYTRVVAPHYNTSAVLNANAPTQDTILPQLPALSSWRMNAAGTAIEAFAPQGGGGGGIGAVLPTITNQLARFADTMGTVANSGIITNANSDILTPGSIHATNFIGKNRIVNGDFQIWQRGAGGAAAIAVLANRINYTADRWQLLTNANQACTVTQITTPGSGSFAARVQRNNGQTGVGTIRFCTSLTRDMCSGLAPFNEVTVSCFLRAGANYSAAGGVLVMNLYTGTGVTDTSGINGAFAGSALILTENIVLNPGNVTFLSFAFTSAVLAANVTQLALEFAYTPVGNAGANDYFDVKQCQIEIGGQQTFFETKTFAKQLLDCQRFYWKTFDYNIAPAQNSGSTNGVISYIAQQTGVHTNGVQINNPVQMRVAPVPVFYNPSAANALWRNATGGADSAAAVVPSAGMTNFLVTNAQVGGDNNGDTLMIHASCDVDVT